MRSLPLLVSANDRESIVRAMAGELGLPRAETNEALVLLRRGLPPLTRRSWLPFLFGVSPKIFGAMASRPAKYYRTFRVTKRSGGFREIVTPRRFLKTVQRWLLEHVVSHFEVSGAAHGFVRGRGIFTNAQAHLSGTNLLAVDVSEFFPSVTRDMVLQLFVNGLPFPEDVASQLVGLMTLKGSLPQGAPTSPALANAVFLPVDDALTSLAGRWNCVYTRYADDIAISGDRRFSGDDLGAVRDALESGGFHLNNAKSRIVGAGDRQEVAGVVVNSSGLPPREVRRRWRATFHRASRYPYEFMARVSQLRGIAAFVNQYDESLANSYFAVADGVAALTGNSPE